MSEDNSLRPCGENGSLAIGKGMLEQQCSVYELGQPASRHLGELPEHAPENQGLWTSKGVSSKRITKRNSHSYISATSFHRFAGLTFDTVLYKLEVCVLPECVLGFDYAYYGLFNGAPDNWPDSHDPRQHR